METRRSDLSKGRLSKGGISFERFIDGFLDEYETNGLQQFGYRRDDIESVRRLKSEVQQFIQTYRSSKEFLKSKKQELDALKSREAEHKESIFKQYGLRIDEETISVYNDIIRPTSNQNRQEYEEYGGSSQAFYDDEEVPF